MTVMHFQTSQRQTIDLGDGLIMRWSTAADTENLQRLLSESFRWLSIGDPHPQDEIPPPNEFIKASIRLLMSGKSCAMKEFDYALVEDTRQQDQVDANPVVACVCLHRIKAYYGSVDLYFGKPELVATDPAYRNRGLVRKLLLEMIHPESEARGDVLQVIPGIMHFYRQFGYEYGLCSYPNVVIEDAKLIPALDKTKYPSGEEPYTLRLATLEDLPFLNRLSSPENRHTNAVVGTHCSAEMWQYIVHDLFQIKQSRFDGDRDTRIIVEAKTGKEVGYTMTSNLFWGSTLQAMALDPEVKDVKYFDVTYPVLRQLFALSKERQAEIKRSIPKPIKKTPSADSEAETSGEKEADATAKPPTEETAVTSAVTPVDSEPHPLSLNLHEKHPLVVLLGSKAKTQPKEIDPGMRLYTRISSYPKFILAVAPELESRLSNSALVGVTGRLRLDFFRSVEGCSAKGLEVVFENGKIVAASNWTNPGHEGLLKERLQWKKQGNTQTIYYATFPPLVFTMLVTGGQSLFDIYMMYGDVGIRGGGDETRLLLNTLFPKGDHHLDMFLW